MQRARWGQRARETSPTWRPNTSDIVLEITKNKRNNCLRVELCEWFKYYRIFLVHRRNNKMFDPLCSGNSKESNKFLSVMKTSFVFHFFLAKYLYWLCPSYLGILSHFGINFCSKGCSAPRLWYWLLIFRLPLFT